MDDTWLDKITYEFSQECNTDGTTRTKDYDGSDGYCGSELLTIEVQSCTNSLTKEPGYFVLRTPTGWSFNDSEELLEVINIVKNGVKTG